MIDPKAVSRNPAKSGGWLIDKITPTEHEARMCNLRSSLNGLRGRNINAEEYIRLIGPGGLWMSNTPAELRDHKEFFKVANGLVLINGLGLGIAAEVVASKKEVSAVVVIENSEDVIKMVKPYMPGKVAIIHEDAWKYDPVVLYDCVWHDIWPDINPDNLVEMKKLRRKYRNNAIWQGCWSEDVLLSLLGRKFKENGMGKKLKEAYQA